MAAVVSLTSEATGLRRCAGHVFGDAYNSGDGKLHGDVEISRAHASSSSSEASMMEPLQPLSVVDQESPAFFQKHVIKHKRSATQVVESLQPPLLAPNVFKHARCRSQSIASPVIPIIDGPPQELCAFLTRLHQPSPQSNAFSPKVVVGVAPWVDRGLWLVGSDEMLQEILAMLALEDIVAFCIASARSHGLRVWMVSRLHFTAQLSRLMWESAAAGARTQVAAEMLQSVQDSFRERSSSREMFIEDARLLERNQARYELDLLEMYEKEHHMNLNQQAALTIMQNEMRSWDDVVKRKDTMESFVRWFSDKVCLLCGSIYAELC